MGEISDYEVCSKLMEYSCVKYPNSDMVNSDVRSMEKEETIFHDPEAHIGLRVTSICEFIFIKDDLSIM